MMLNCHQDTVILSWTTKGNVCRHLLLYHVHWCYTRHAVISTTDFFASLRVLPGIGLISEGCMVFVKHFLMRWGCSFVNRKWNNCDIRELWMIGDDGFYPVVMEYSRNLLKFAVNVWCTQFISCNHFFKMLCCMGQLSGECILLNTATLHLL